MAIVNKAVQIRGADARVAVMQLYPQPDGNVVIVISGQTKDSEGLPHALKEAQVIYSPGANDAMDDLLKGCLAALRKVNGLEDGAVTFEPVADVNAVLSAKRAAALPAGPKAAPKAP